MSGARRDKQAGLLLDESLIFERSSPGRCACRRKARPTPITTTC